MKYYLINESVNWADEFELPFFELLDEDAYNFYMYAKSKLKRLIDSFYFGTNEGWDLFEYYDGTLEGFDYLQFTPIEIPKSDYFVLNKYFPSGVYQIIFNLFEKLRDLTRLNFHNSTLSYEDYYKIIDELSNT